MEYSEPTRDVFYTFQTNDDELLFNITYLRISKYGINKLCEDLLIKYSENENIMLLCRDKKIDETIQNNIINELTNANIIIDHDAKDKIVELLSGAYIYYNYNADDIINHVFGFIPKAMQFSFID